MTEKNINQKESPAPIAPTGFLRRFFQLQSNMRTVEDVSEVSTKLVGQEKDFQTFTKDDLIQLPRASDGHLLPAIPEMDGIEHICINFHGQTQCGKMLSNFYQKDFEHPYFGKFNNIEAFWQWLKSTSRPDRLRSMRAKEAKAFGKTLNKRVVPDFYEAIIDANYHRVLQHPEIRNEVMESSLPFEYYYLHPVSRIAIHPNDRETHLFHSELLRKWIKGEAKPFDLDYAKILND